MGAAAFVGTGCGALGGTSRHRGWKVGGNASAAPGRDAAAPGDTAGFPDYPFPACWGPPRPPSRLSCLGSVRPDAGHATPPIRETSVRKTTPRRVDKPWGHELVWAENDLYVGKILHVKEGEALSLQLHRQKDETMHVLSGRVRLWVGPSADTLEETVLEEGEGVRLTPGTVHRVEALADSDILEASTPHLQDLVRLEDRYGRMAGSG